MNYFLYIYSFTIIYVQSLTDVHCLIQIEERQDVKHYLQNTQTETVAMNIQSNYSKCLLDDDGRLKRTGSLYFNLISNLYAVVV